MAKESELGAILETIGSTPPKLSLAARIRRFWDELFYSQHVRFLERELIEVRLANGRETGRLLSEKREMAAKIERLEAALLPRAATAQADQPRPAQAFSLPPSKWEQVYAAEARMIADEEDVEQNAKKEN